MADSKGKAKRTYISPSSSSSEEDDVDFEADGFYGSSSSGDETEEEEGNESDDNDRDEDDESLCNRVIDLVKEGGELESLSLKQCKAYLHNHGLRITGSRAVCQQRVLEHWKIKDGNTEAFYPRASFYINCTGDVCKGDVVLFTQKVFENDEAWETLGRRTVAGRVGNESYGKAKQQHAFTVEVLWSKGTKKLPPLFPLLVKGRNLYKLKTYRQAERRKVLAEKHRRGNAARLVKAMKEMMRRRSRDAGERYGKKHKRHLHGKAPIPRHANLSDNYQPTSLVRQVKKKQNSRSRVIAMKNPVHLTEDIGASRYTFTGPVLSQYQSQSRFNNQSAPLQVGRYDMGSTSNMVRSLPYRPYIDACTIPSAEYQEFQVQPSQLCQLKSFL